MSKKTPWTKIKWDWVRSEMIGVCNCPLCGYKIKITAEQVAPRYLKIDCENCKEALLIKDRKVFPFLMKKKEEGISTKN